MSVPMARAGSKLRALPQPALQQRLRLSAADERRLDWGASPSALLDQLCRMDLVREAVRLLAYALPEREAVWWGCMCVAHAACPSAAERAALDAAEAWVRCPDEAAARQAAWAAAACGHHLAGAWPALAAYWSQRSGESDGGCGLGVETAAALAARRRGPDGERETLSRFVVGGRDVAGGGPGRLPPPAPSKAEDTA